MRAKGGVFGPGWDLRSCPAGSGWAMSTLYKAAAWIWGGKVRLGGLPGHHEWLGVVWMHAMPAVWFVSLMRIKSLVRKALAKRPRL